MNNNNNNDDDEKGKYFICSTYGTLGIKDQESYNNILYMNM